MFWSEHSVCSDCMFFFKLSNEDKKLLGTTISQKQFDFPFVVGYCTVSNLKHNYIFEVLFEYNPKSNCSYKKTGIYSIRTPFRCLECDECVVVINDPDGCKFFYCPTCEKTFYSLMIDTRCNLCKTQLYIYASNFFKCECKNCEKAVNVPVLPHIYPSIIPKGELCIHDKMVMDCQICLNSRKVKGNILGIEINEAIKRHGNRVITTREVEDYYYLKGLMWEKEIWRGIRVKRSQLYFDKYKILRYDEPLIDWSDSFDDIEDWSDSFDYSDLD